MERKGTISGGLAIRASLVLILPLLAAGCGRSDPSPQAPPSATPAKQGPARPKNLEEARAAFKSGLRDVAFETDGPAPVPPATELELVKYDSPAGKLAAYVTPDPKDGRKHPAVVWAHGGFGGIGEWFWGMASKDDDQSARAFREAGIVLMCPSWRGENDNPGKFELFYGEVDDLLAARDWLAARPWVDPERIYLAGHSTGGTLVLLAAVSTDRFRAAFVFGGAPDFGNIVPALADWGIEAPFDTKNAEEIRMRNPIAFAASVRRPTWYFEGAESFYPQDARRFQHVAEKAGAPMRTFIIPRGDHFNILAPVTTLLAKKILADTGPECAIEIRLDEIRLR